MAVWMVQCSIHKRLALAKCNKHITKYGQRGLDRLICEVRVFSGVAATYETKQFLGGGGANSEVNPQLWCPRMFLEVAQSGLRRDDSCRKTLRCLIRLSAKSQKIPQKTTPLPTCPKIWEGVGQSNLSGDTFSTEAPNSATTPFL